MKKINMNKIKLNKEGEVLWVTDIHMQNSNLDRCRKLFSFIAETVHEKQIKTIICGGDIYDGKDIIRSKCQNLLFSFLSDMKKRDVDFIALVGNHDYEETVNASHHESGEYPDHSLKPLENLSNVTIVDFPTVIGDIGFIPYRGSNTHMLLSLNCVKDAKYLFTHEGVSGYDFGTGRMDDFSLTPDKYSGFKKVYAGHYHACKVMDNIIFLGSPLTHSFGEANQVKNVGIINFNKKGFLDLLPVKLPQHLSIDVSTETDANDMPDLSDNSDYFVRFVVSGKKEALSIAEGNLREKYGHLNNLKIVLKPEIQRANRMNIAEEMKEDKMLEVYLNNFNTDLDKSKLLEMAKEFMESE